MKIEGKGICDLTDEEILKEFMARFSCDGAALIYLEDGREYGFLRWRNKAGKDWAKELGKLLKKCS
jgi:hypothetical protein